jgi:hypothetical protein
LQTFTPAGDGASITATATVKSPRTGFEPLTRIYARVNADPGSLPTSDAPTLAPAQVGAPTRRSNNARHARHDPTRPARGARSRDLRRGGAWASGGASGTRFVTGSSPA